MTQEQSKFTHTPAAPEVSAGEHAWQRRFNGHGGERAVYPEADPYSEAQVFRDAGKKVAELRINVNRGAAYITVHLELEPAPLRELAQRLLDAAHDIEANPAKGAA